MATGRDTVTASSTHNQQQKQQQQHEAKPAFNLRKHSYQTTSLKTSSDNA
jgi:hypothetical protein